MVKEGITAAIFKRSASMKQPPKGHRKMKGLLDRLTKVSKSEIETPTKPAKRKAAKKKK